MQSVKTANKLNSLGESHSQTESGFEEMLLDLGRALYKLHFQILLLVEASKKMVIALHNAAKNSQASLVDMSAEIASMRQSLARSIEIDSGESERGTPTPSPSPQPEVNKNVHFQKKHMNVADTDK